MKEHEKEIIELLRGAVCFANTRDCEKAADDVERLVYERNEARSRVNKEDNSWQVLLSLLEESSYYLQKDQSNNNGMTPDQIGEYVRSTLYELENEKLDQRERAKDVEMRNEDLCDRIQELKTLREEAEAEIGRLRDCVGELEDEVEKLDFSEATWEARALDAEMRLNKIQKLTDLSVVFVPRPWEKK